MLEEYYQRNHNDLYKYFTHIKENKKELWEKEPGKIIDDIIKHCSCSDRKYPDYIIKVFEDINTKIEEDEDYDYVNKFETLNKKLNKKLTTKIDKYLDL